MPRLLVRCVCRTTLRGLVDVLQSQALHLGIPTVGHSADQPLAIGLLAGALYPLVLLACLTQLLLCRSLCRCIHRR